MASNLPTGFPQNSELTNDLIDKILVELWQWRKAGTDANGSLHIDNLDSDEPPHFWIFGNNLQVGVAQNLTGSDISAGSIASPILFTATQLILSGTGPGLTSTGGNTFDCYNAYPGIISNNYLVFTVDLYGYTYVLTAACAT